MIHPRVTRSQWIATLVGIYNTASTINTGKRIIASFLEIRRVSRGHRVNSTCWSASIPFPPGSYTDFASLRRLDRSRVLVIGKVAGVATGGRPRAVSSAVSAWRTCDPSRSKSHEKRRIVSWPVIWSRTRLINARQLIQFHAADGVLLISQGSVKCALGRIGAPRGPPSRGGSLGSATKITNGDNLLPRICQKPGTYTGRLIRWDTVTSSG